MNSVIKEVKVGTFKQHFYDLLIVIIGFKIGNHIHQRDVDQEPVNLGLYTRSLSPFYTS